MRRLIASVRLPIVRFNRLSQLLRSSNSSGCERFLPLLLWVFIVIKQLMSSSFYLRSLLQMHATIVPILVRLQTVSRRFLDRFINVRAAAAAVLVSTCPFCVQMRLIKCLRWRWTARLLL